MLTSTLNPKVKGCGQPAAISVNTHCECVVGKLPLQSIQLSKSLGNQLRFQTYRRLNLSRADQTCSSIRRGARSAPPANTGGEYRARTGDLLVANQALSQLS